MAKSSSRTLIWIALVWLIIASLMTFLLWPTVPKSISSWFVFALLAPPVYVIGKLIAETRIAKSILEHPSKVIRIASRVLIGFVFLMTITIISMKIK